MDLKAIAKHYGVTLDDVYKRGVLVQTTLDDPGTFVLLKKARPTKIADVLVEVEKTVPAAVKKFLPARNLADSDGKHLSLIVKAIRTDARLVEAKTELGAENITKIDGVKPVGPVEPVDPIVEDIK